MDSNNDSRKTFHRLKREKPFKPFSIVTTGGQRYPVQGRFHFAYNQDYVAVLDDRGIPVHVDHVDIAAIEVTAGQSSSGAG